jgi:hypothetical protein
VLLGALVDAARAGGIRAFIAHALPSNVGVRRLMARHGVLDARRLGGDPVLWLDLRSERSSIPHGERAHRNPTSV